MCLVRGPIEKRIDTLGLADRLGSGLPEQRLGQLGQEPLDTLRVGAVAEVIVARPAGRPRASAETADDRGDGQPAEQRDSQPA